MAGVMQSEYRCPIDGWRQFAASAKTLFWVQHEERDKDGCVELIDLRQSSTGNAGVMLCVFPRQGDLDRETTLTVAMHWISNSAGKDKDASRKLAEQVEAMLLMNGAVCCRSPVKPAGTVFSP